MSDGPVVILRYQRDGSAVRTELAERELGADHDWSGWTTPEAVVPAVVFLAAQIGTDFTGRIVDAGQFGVSWP